MDVRARFAKALEETVDEWKEKSQVEGVYVHGSYARGNITGYSDLDICIVWNDREAPVRLLAEHKSVRIDMTFLTPEEIESVLEETTEDPYKIAAVISRLKDANVEYDRNGSLKTWQQKAATYRWSAEVIQQVKEEAMRSLRSAEIYANNEDFVSAINEVRNGLFDLGRVIVMKSNRFCIIKPAEVLTEIRLLEPIAYQLFIRTFRLKGLNEEEILGILDNIEQWIELAVERADSDTVMSAAIEHLSQAQREFYGASNLAMMGDYELALLEIRLAIGKLGHALLNVEGIELDDRGRLAEDLQEREPEFFDKVFVKYGAFDFQPRGINRSIGEAQFIAQRL